MIKYRNNSTVQNHQSGLSNAFELSDCLAKTYRAPDDRSYPGRTVLNHCEIVGSVARELILRMPNWLKDIFFPDGSELVAAAHDIGKVSPTFQEKIYRGTSDYSPNSKFGLENINPELEKNWGGHAGVSQVTAQDLKCGKYIPEVLGQHHGYSPPIAGKLSLDEIFGGNAWHARRVELVSDLKKSLNSNWPQVESALHARVLSGLTTVSDWIGSGEFFEDPKAEWKKNIKLSLDNAGFVSPKFQSDLIFENIFGFDARDSQKKLFENAIQPGVYILEAPMGLGKTEAALYAAYLAMSANKATGFYFALPTQLTSDKIYTRVNEFLSKILASDCQHRQALLLHGNAWLQDKMGEDGKPGGSWFNSSKRGILAPFAVGTIDQALMAVMNVKHGFVRTFGLIGKVVILDEVHTYDSYTGTILDELIKQLRELHCTVIILSATLTKNRREAFLSNAKSNASDYPLISALSNDNKLNEITVEKLEDKKVIVQHCKNDCDAIEEALNRAEQGQQVLWIENTVNEAQEKFSLLASRGKEFNIDVGLLHSRFIKTDRETHEKKWVELYGKKNGDIRQLRGRILVGTQVLEQSLDIDADFLVTRICPTDMLLQRIGRLWRHSDTVRPSRAQQEMWMLSPLLKDAIENAEKTFGKTAKVYSPYVLCRSLEIWYSLKIVSIPSQIRELIEATYVQRVESAKLSTYKDELNNEREKLQRLALVGLSKGGKTLPENKASTRYSELESVEVLLLKSYFVDSDKRGINIVLLSNEALFLPSNVKTQSRKSWRTLAAKLMKNTVRVPEYLAPEKTHENNLNSLKDYIYLGEEGDRIRVVKVHESGEIAALNSSSASSNYHIYYSELLGYQANKK